MRRLVFSLALIGTLTLSGCALDQMIKASVDQQVVVTPNPLELHADTVTFEVSATLPLKMLKKGKIYTVYPFYTYNGTELALEGIEFKADDFTDPTVQPRLTQSFSFPYTPEMKQGEIFVEGEARDPNNGKSVRTPERLKLVDGVITTSLLTQDPFGVTFADHGYNNQEELIPTNISFFFAQGRSQLRRSETRSDRGQEFDAFIAAKNVTRTVTITGTHSPEGSERINSDLAKDRAEAIEKWYRGQMDKYDYQGMADSIEFILKPVVEDWGLFLEMLDDYNEITAEQKGEVRRIVNGSGDFESKEDELGKLSFYKQLFDDLYPELRRAKSDILTVKPKKSDAQISILAKQVYEGAINADTLTIEELMYAATLTPSMDEKMNIYQAAVKKSDSWQAHNNLGASLLALANRSGDQAQIEKAVTHLEQAKLKAGSNAMPAANLGMAYYMQGNFDGAYETMGEAADMRPGTDLMRQVNAVRGVVEIKKGMYNQAVTTFANIEGNAPNYTNKGLAMILNKDYQTARTALGDAIEEDSNYAMAYYLAAVSAARLQNEADVIANLVKAIDANPELKEMAVIDLEFANYQSNADFQAALD